MTEYLLIQAFVLLQLLVVVPIGVGTWWALLRLMDKWNRVVFRYELDKFKSPEIYYGARALAAAYLVAELYNRLV